MSDTFQDLPLFQAAKAARADMPPVLADAFEAVSDAPNGIPKLRELILDLAVRGKLVPQDPNDEPASKLLKRIEAEKARLVKEKKIRKPKPLPPLPVDNVIAFGLPTNWNWVRFGQLGWGFQNGLSKRTGKQGTPVLVIRLADICGRRVTVTARSREILLTAGETDKYGLGPDDILITRVNGSADLVGNFNLVRALTQDTAYCDHFIRLRPCHGHVDMQFVQTTASSRLVRDQIEGLFITTAGQKTVNQGHICSLLFPFPPLAEQKRIVAKVDALMALCDELEAKQSERQTVHLNLHKASLASLTDVQDATDFADRWRHVADNFDTLVTTPESVTTLRQTILDLAVRGKLVPQDPNDEPASELLKRIAAEKGRLVKEKKIRKPKKLPPIDRDELPFDLPQGWDWSKIGSLASKVEYGTSHRSSPTAEGIGVFGMGHIVNGRLRHDRLKCVPATIKDLPKLYLQRGDILFNRTNSAELVGKSALYIGQDNSLTFASYLIRVVVLEASPEYIVRAMNAPYYRATQIVPELTQQCGQANFNGTKLQNTVVPLPPLPEQKRIMAKVDALMALCDKLEAGLRESSTVSEKLASAVVASVG